MSTEQRSSFLPWMQTGGSIFISGQTDFNPETRAIKDSTEEQTLADVERVPRDSHARIGQKVKTSAPAFRGIRLFQRMNAYYVTIFRRALPTRSTVQAILSNPEMLVEIETIAYVEM
jgi:enamine deaminase RidA (YjgF/YER057c/UK114 family)